MSFVHRVGSAALRRRMAIGLLSSVSVMAAMTPAAHAQQAPRVTAAADIHFEMIQGDSFRRGHHRDGRRRAGRDTGAEVPAGRRQFAAATQFGRHVRLDMDA